MISTKTKKLPVKQNGPRVKRGSGLSATDLESTIAIVRDVFPQLVIECRSFNVEQAEEAIRNTLFAKRVGPQFEYNEPGEPHLIAIAEGLLVAHQGRGGTVTWLDIAGELSTNDFEDEDTHRGEASNGPPQFTSAMIPIILIEVVRNERTDFDEQSLAELAESIKTHGLIEPLVLRKVAAPRIGYHLVAGERRLRAAKLAGLMEVPARYAVMTEVQADEIRIVENLQRKDLSAIEEARGFERMLKAHGYTQEKLAERLDVSQPHIANRLRLLKLPEKWQQRVISQEIPPTHARSILPWVEHPTILDAIEKGLYDKKGELYHDISPVSSFTTECERFARGATQPLTGAEYEYQLGRQVEIFTPTAAELAELGVVTVPDWNGNDTQRATNVKLWKKLRAKQLKPLIAAKPKPNASHGAQATGKAKSTRVSDARFDGDLNEWRMNWLMFILGREVDRQIDAGETDLALKAILVSFVDALDGVTSSDVAKAIGFTGKVSYMPGGSAKLLEALIQHREPGAAILELATGLFWEGPFDKKGHPSHGLEYEAIEALANWLAIDLSELWHKELAGPLTEAFFNLHDVERLVKLGAELDVYIKPRTSKTAAIKQLMGHRNTKLKLPSVIKPVAARSTKKPAAAKPKPKPKKAKA